MSFKNTRFFKSTKGLLLVALGLIVLIFLFSLFIDFDGLFNNQHQSSLALIDSDSGLFYDYADLPAWDDLEIVEEWFYEYDLDTDGNFAQEVIEYNGQLFMYLNHPSNRAVGKVGGIAISLSDDGVEWTQENTLLVEDTDEYSYSHPYAVEGPDGNLYLYVQTNVGSGKDTFKYVSYAVSEDGLNFSEFTEFLACDEGCAHGRFLQLEDGTYLLAVSASVNKAGWNKQGFGRLPYVPGIWMVYSDDLVEWKFSDVYIPACHDPTFDDSGDEIYVYCATELLEGTLRFSSPDGYEWTPEEPDGLVQFYDEDGEELGQMEDIDLHSYADGSTRMYGSIFIEENHQSTVWSFMR
ncbi:MAG: sialidase family protein [bacterium]|jgi:hypothetical protein|nr:sialidase family protein [bacterium]